jgi:hypothetical protein
LLIKTGIIKEEATAFCAHYQGLNISRIRVKGAEGILSMFYSFLHPNAPGLRQTLVEERASLDYITRWLGKRYIEKDDLRKDIKGTYLLNHRKVIEQHRKSFLAHVMFDRGNHPRRHGYLEAFSCP